jgi:hypothetical protein
MADKERMIRRSGREVDENWKSSRWVGLEFIISQLAACENAANLCLFLATRHEVLLFATGTV